MHQLIMGGVDGITAAAMITVDPRGRVALPAGFCFRKMEKISMRSISKVFVAAAVAGACGYASAATITVPAQALPFSRQGAQILTTTDLSYTTISPSVTIQDGYVNLDTMRFTSPSGATFASADTGGHTAAFTCSTGGTSSVVFTYTAASSSTSTVVYTAATPTASTAGMSCIIPSINIRNRSLTSTGNVTLALAGIKTTTALTFDTSAAVAVATVVDQFTVGVSSTDAFNGVIDVSASRLSFATGASTTGVGNLTHFDTFSVTVTATATALSVSAATMTLTLTAGSSFAFLQEPDGQVGGGSCTVTSGTGQAAATGTAGAGTVTVLPTSGACNVMTVSFATVAAGGTYTVGLGRRVTTDVPNITNSSAFAPQSYTAGASVGSGAVTLATLASGAPAGVWSLNGTTINIPYVPISSAINLQLFMSNRSTQTGNVTFTAWNASGTSCTGILGTVNPTSQASFGSSLRAALQACTGTGWSDASRAIVQILSTTPSADTEVHSAFGTVDGVSRQVLINNTQGRGQ